MKLIKKTDLRFVQGRLIDDTTGEALCLSELAYQANEIIEMIDFNAFIAKNATAIRVSVEAEPVVYSPPKRKPAAFDLLSVPETPLHDAVADEKKELAAEWLAKQGAEDVNSHLARYDALAAWFSDEYVEAHSGPASTFVGDIFELSTSSVIAAVKEFNDHDNVKLRGLVVFEH